MPRALKSVHELADEIIVVDTGSTDETVMIAESLGARTSHFPWGDDFSAAYNHCFERATGDWIFTLDADEELLEASYATLRASIARDDAFAYFVLRQDIVDSRRMDEFTEVALVRLWRNHRDVRYQGRIHSQFAKPLVQIGRSCNQHLLASDIQLRHYGLANSDIAAKNDRSIRLLELELRDRPRQFYYLVELGRTRLANGDAGGVAALVEAASMVVAKDPRALGSGGALAMLLESTLATDVLPADFPLTWPEARGLALEMFPRAVPLLWQIAQYEFRHDQYDACAELLERVIQLGRSGRYDRHVSFCPAIMCEDALLNLGVCYVRMVRLDEAAECFLQLKNDPRHAMAAADNLSTIDRLRRR